VSQFDAKESRMRIEQRPCFYPFAEFPRIVAACSVSFNFSTAQEHAGAPRIYGLGRLEEVAVIAMLDAPSLVADRKLHILWISKTSPFAFLSANLL
jgi:hypothetical protein